MMYLSQFLIILSFSLAGELLQRLIPLPIPASVYGIVLLFSALCLKLLRVEQVKQAGSFLSSLLPLLFVSPVAGLLENWGLVQNALLPLLILTGVSTVLAFYVSGRTAQALLEKEESHGTAG